MTKDTPPQVTSLAGTITTPTISIRFLVPVFRYLHKHHPRQAEQYLKQLSLDEQQFESEDEIGMDCFQNILEQAARECDDPTIGLHIYEELEFSSLGILGYALASVPNIGRALELHSRFYHLYQSGVELKTTHHGDRVHQSYRILSQSIDYSRQDSEISMMYTIYLIRNLAKPDWRPLEAYFQHAEPEDISEHKRLICNRIFFNQPTNKLVFSKDTLKLPITNANAHLADTLEEALRRIDKIKDNSEDSLLEKVQYQIVSSLPDVLATIDDIATKLALTPRTLQRRLSEQGYSFSQVLDLTRQHLAVHYLVDTQIASTEIAFLLGYSESSAFDRAFKRWTGTAPLDYRNSHNQENEG